METENVSLAMAKMENDKTAKGLIKAIYHYPKLKIVVGLRTTNDVIYIEYPRQKMLKNLLDLNEYTEMEWQFSNFWHSGGTIMVG